MHLIVLQMNEHENEIDQTNVENCVCVGSLPVHFVRFILFTFFRHSLRLIWNVDWCDINYAQFTNR